MSIDSQQGEWEINNSIIITSKIKYLGIYLVNNVKDLPRKKVEIVDERN
jgi:hypothetical protein